MFPTVSKMPLVLLLLSPLMVESAVAVVGAPPPHSAAGVPARRRLSLDGGGWHLQLDPSDTKVTTMAANGSKVSHNLARPLPLLNSPRGT